METNEPVELTLILCTPTTLGTLRENDRALGTRHILFDAITHVGPTIECPPGYWSHYTGQPTCKPVPNGGGLFYATFRGPAEVLEAFAAEAALLDHYKCLHSSMWSGPVNPRQRQIAEAVRCGCCPTSVAA